ncbi:hypothetical protein BC829DRAFT_276978 [Chytridium lagenaria]|nr:hypothetical protein BC829DRAFT_276978 [Chytridium lagenaria]
MAATHITDPFVDDDGREETRIMYDLTDIEVDPGIRRIICIAIDESEQSKYAFEWTLDHLIVPTKVHGDEDLIVLTREFIFSFKRLPFHQSITFMK